MIQELSAEMQTLQNQIDQLQRTLVLRAQTQRTKNPAGNVSRTSAEGGSGGRG